MGLSTKNKVGLVLCGLLGVLDCFSFAMTPEPGAMEGPPQWIVELDTVLGVVTVIAAVMALRTASRAAVLTTVGARILSLLTALPAFFVDIPMSIKLAVAAFGVVTIVASFLALAPAASTAGGSSDS